LGTHVFGAYPYYGSYQPNATTTYTTLPSGGGGSVTITAWNATTQVVSGTFAFTGVISGAAAGLPATVSVTQGSFTNAGPLP
jgi:hypothetical protein